MPVLAPSTAERIRSACSRATGAMLAAEGADPATVGVAHLLDDGSFALTVPTAGLLAAMALAAGSSGTAAVLELTDYAPLPLREPVRSLVWVQGRLHHIPAADVAELLDLIAVDRPDPALLAVHTTAPAAVGRASAAADPANVPHTLLRLDVDSVVAADSTGAEAIGLGALLDARPDPFCAVESCWLQHLESAHRDVVDRLADRLPAPLRRGRVRPLALDRYGVALRVEDAAGDHDVRLPFPTPVDDVAGLNQAIRVLMGCPFLNGLRARRI